MLAETLSLRAHPATSASSDLLFGLSPRHAHGKSDTIAVDTSRLYPARPIGVHR